MPRAVKPKGGKSGSLKARAKTATRVAPKAKAGRPKAKVVKAKLGRPKAVKYATGPSDEVKQAAILLKQVSDPTRLQILLILSNDESNVGDLCSVLGGQSQPAVSHHLALLRHGRLIGSRRQGKNNIYSLTDQGRMLADTVSSLAH
jgi:DNA-binding transcriptional ArsR family regulator